MLEVGRATNGQPFLVLPVIQGPTFSEQLAAANAPGPIVALLARVADAIAHAHAAGIVHGHLGPASIQGDWIAGWAKARDVSGKIPDLEERPEPSTDLNSLRGLLKEAASHFEDEDLEALAKAAPKDAAALADELREALAAPPPPAPASRAGSSRLLAAPPRRGVRRSRVFLLAKRTNALTADLEKTRGDLKARDDQDTKRAASEKARGLIAEAVARARAGETDAVRKLVQDALALERTEPSLTRGGLALARAGDVTGGRELLKAGDDRDAARLRGARRAPRPRREARSHRVAPRSPRAREGRRRRRALARDRRERRGDREARRPRALRAAERAVAAALRDPASAPRLSYAWVCRATARGATADLNGALADWERALELEPRRAASWCERSGVRRRKGQLDRAESDADEALKIDAKLALAYVRRAQVELDVRTRRPRSRT